MAMKQTMVCSNQEDVFKRIADTIEGSGRIVQKRLSNNALKFHILPMKQSEVRVENDKSS
ncbi:uncharacterized protein LOC111057387 isoform X2 [Nilaparvata lugens]|uniref:uncharacterized protein LOC111057387 isoform X2 n=1 Tax=Nilaparvata lugens TaxID=108931 RepID=UPI00193E498E|nr:uncharacterized protein LOC111057387 isoform X2 [Nilaparvata lugens]